MIRFHSLGILLLAAAIGCSDSTTGPFLRLPVILEHTPVTPSSSSVPTISTAADTVIAQWIVQPCQEYTAQAAIFEHRVEITISEELPLRFCIDVLSADVITVKLAGIPPGRYVAELHGRYTSTKGDMVFQKLTSTSVTLP